MKHNLKEKSKEWVGAPNLETNSESITPGGQTFTPSDRDFRADRRNKLRELQATDAKLKTANRNVSVSTDTKKKAKLTEFMSSEAHVTTDSKMHSTPQPETHHRITESPISPEIGLETENLKAELHTNFIHQKRAQDSPIPKIKQMKQKINFPPSNSKSWDKVNRDLEKIIPAVFPDKLIRKLSTTELSQKFDSWLHQFFLEQFGEKKKHENLQRKRTPRSNPQLAFLRNEKKNAKQHTKL